ncbi:uracil-xanthine permease family protein [Promicromonospora thailandica]|uniref:Uracil-xanthine permease n=1 Tax=Promicromonospora thailandica TaxID=765201 RepID=A0A9X2G3E1_9MICO|nr:solute carrier family 23 protein [Promicromonospora thailandica]MCP2266350.1 uracil-xanthine permease [Promicromonospora thailandica]BFF20025.1 solute carrier family 23 protein [Promicromonospora thailandica]
MRLGWKLHGDGARIAPGEVVAPDERLSWPRTIGIGLQHVVAMFGATFLVPVLTGFDPATTLFFSALGTIAFLLITGNKLPSYLGSSFAFIAPITAATASGGQAVALGGILATGVLLALVGVVVHVAGARWIQIVMPPVVTGVIVALIGLNLAPVAWGACGEDGACTGFQAAPLTATVTLASIILIQVLFRGLVGRLAILLGVVIGYVFASLRGEVDLAAVNKAAWVGLPHFTAPAFDPGVLGLFLPVVLVLVAENVGHVKSVAAMTGRDYDHLTGRALLADGLATTLAGVGGGSGTTTYAENIGVMAASRVYSTAAYWVAAVGALVLSLSPKFGALINSVPQGVLGGVTTMLYGMIGILGARIWVQARVDFSDPVNLTTAAVPLIIGIANFTWAAGDLQFGGIALGTAAALVIYHVMRVVGRWRGTVQG